MPSVTYRSTRGGQTGVDFRTVVMQGLARDRGLFVPETFPTITEQELKEWRGLSYPDLAVQVIRKYVDDDQVPFHVLNDIVHRSCKAFRHPDVTPVVNVGGHAILVRVNIYKYILVIVGRDEIKTALHVSNNMIPPVLSFNDGLRNCSTAPHLPSRTLPCRCWETFSSTS